MALREAALFEVLLMILLCSPELGRRDNLRDDGPLETALDGVARGARFGFLFRRMKENHRTVLRADVRTLAILSGRIMVVPESFEQIVVADDRGVESDLHDFSV